LKKNYFTRQLLAALMLCVFLFGITPKKLLHTIVANHTDSVPYKTDAAKPTQVSTAGFNCQVENLVAESPFEPTGNAEATSAPRFYYLPAIRNVEIKSVQLIISSPRGPPSFA
jgi:hypothetical protein